MKVDFISFICFSVSVILFLIFILPLSIGFPTDEPWLLYWYGFWLFSFYGAIGFLIAGLRNIVDWKFSTALTLAFFALVSSTIGSEPIFISLLIAISFILILLWGYDNRKSNHKKILKKH